MIQKITAEERFLAQHDWLSTYHLFSFADYYDPDNMNFGLLRVFNDDTIDAESGFGTHSHNNMEIITIVLEGELTHKDSMGSTGVIKAGEIQYMSAGTGVTHSEMNMQKSPVHLYQIWILPKEKNLEPRYAQKDFSHTSNKNILLPIVSSELQGEALQVRSDATIYTSSLEAGQSIDYNLGKNRGAFIYSYEGALRVNDVVFNAHSQARIQGEEYLTIASIQDAKFILIDVAMD